MIDMKRAPKKPMKSLRPEVRSMEEEKYPYGLCITLDKEELKKLGSGFYVFSELTSENIKSINKYMIDFKALNKDILTSND